MLKSAISLCFICVALCVLSACRNENSTAPQNNAQPSPTTAAIAPNSNSVPKRGIKMSSSAFADGGMMPSKYTCDGENMSPPLKWEGVPEKAKTLALFVVDSDVPGVRFTHWILFNLSASAKELPEHIPTEAQPAGVASQGTNDFKKLGYGGPCPPDGTHHYIFKLYALDSELTLSSTATRVDLLNAMQGHILAQGELTGTYEKKK